MATVVSDLRSHLFNTYALYNAKCMGCTSRWHAGRAPRAHKK